MRSSSIRPNLSSEDRDVKRKLVKCLPRAYSELIRSNITGSSGSKSSRPSTLRPSPPSVMKFSHERPPIVKPTKGELQARVETLFRRPRSVKRKSHDSLEKSHSTWGKAPRLGTSSSSPSAHVQVQGQAFPSPTEVPRALSSQPRFASAAKAKDSSERAFEPLLEVMSISVWSPPTQSAEPPPSIPEDLGRERLRAYGDEDFLLSNAELATGAISSILRDSDLKRSDALLVEEALALSLQGVAFVSSRVFICLLLSWVCLSRALTLCWVLASGYPSEEFYEKGQTERGSCQSRLQS